MRGDGTSPGVARARSATTWTVTAPALHDRPQPDGSDRRAGDGPPTCPALAATLARAFEHNPGTGVGAAGARATRFASGSARVLGRRTCSHDVAAARRVRGRRRGSPAPRCGCRPDGWEVPDRRARLRLLADAWSPPGALDDRAGAALLRSWRRSKHPHEPHWYLAVLGVDSWPRGFGAAPDGAGARNAATVTGPPAYLETDTEQNVALYERHGFRGHRPADPAGRRCAHYLADVARSGLTGLQKRRMKRRNWC